MNRVSVSVYPEARGTTSLGDKAFIGISLNNRLSASPALLREVISWSLVRLPSFDILVGDLLERHNYQAFQGLTSDEALDRALQDGRRLTDLIRELGAVSDQRAEILLASRLAQDPSYAGRLIRFRKLYQSDQRFRRPIDAAITAFISRRHPLLPLSPDIFDHSVEYQLEELAAFELLADSGYTTFVYPGSQLHVMKEMVGGNLPNVSHSLQKLILVELRIFT